MQFLPLSTRFAASTAAIASVVTFLSACEGKDASAPEPVASAYGHVHGVGFNPGDQRIYIATHAGVFRLSDGKAKLVANRQQDTMGFTVTGPDQFLASGHPSLSDAQAVNPLGLIRSSDRAETWNAVAFEGERDFHSIDAESDYVYAYPSEGVLFRQESGGEWAEILRAELIDFAANPVDSNQLIATTDAGIVIEFSVGTSPRPVTKAPPLAFIDRTSSGAIVGVDPVGKVFTSRDDGESWNQVAGVKGVPEAISVRADLWLLAADTGLFSSNDEGKSWQDVE